MRRRALTVRLICGAALHTALLLLVGRGPPHRRPALHTVAVAHILYVLLYYYTIIAPVAGRIVVMNE